MNCKACKKSGLLGECVKCAVLNGKPLTVESKKDKFDTVGFIMDFEEGVLNRDEIISGFQALINSGIVWTLQGSYGRAAASLIEQGLCIPAKNSKN
jgi:hypothetical protein